MRFIEVDDVHVHEVGGCIQWNVLDIGMEPQYNQPSNHDLLEAYIIMFVII